MNLPNIVQIPVWAFQRIWRIMFCDHTNTTEWLKSLDGNEIVVCGRCGLVLNIVEPSEIPGADLSESLKQG